MAFESVSASFKTISLASSLSSIMPSEFSGSTTAFASPSKGKPVKTTTSSRVGQNSPHAVTKVWDSTLHLEIKNSRSAGLLLIYRCNR